MNISILLPYKENYSSEYPGAVSLFVSSIYKNSTYKSRTKIYGSTDYKKFLSKNYVNLKSDTSLFKSKTNNYINNFIAKLDKKNDLIEVHNRPSYVFKLLKLKKKIVLFYHNDPNSMQGSKTIKEKILLLNECSKIIFNSNWSKNQFLYNLPNQFKKSQKLIVIYQSIKKKKIDFNKKEKLISFVGKLNSAKGYDIFGKSIIKILDKYSDWKAHVIGDEPRESYDFVHKNLKILGFKNHNYVLSNFEKSSIAVVCSRWNEPFGRTSLEAASRGCASIISDRGGLPETTSKGIILNELNSKNVYGEIEKLIKDKNKLVKIQKETYESFYLTDKFITQKIDEYRSILDDSKINSHLISNKSKVLKILHVTNFNERHNGRLFYNTGRRINNGFIRLNHNVLELSDRDIISYSRNIIDPKGSNKLNKKFIEIVSNFLPDLIVFGHADMITNKSIKFVKNNFPKIKFSQWFLDRMDGEWKNNKERFSNKMNFMDTNFCTTDPKSLNLNFKDKTFFMPNCVDKSLDNLKVYKNKSTKSDIFFAMSHGVHRGILKKGKVDQRETFINKLIKINPKVVFKTYGLNNIQPVWAENYLNAISDNKIGLNLSQGNPGYYYSSDRFAQLIGNGLMVIIDKNTKIGNFFNNDEIVTYKDISDLSKKITKYLNNDKLRIKIAKKGREKYFKYFNSKIVAEYIINKTFKVKKKYFWEKFF